MKKITYIIIFLVLASCSASNKECIDTNFFSLGMDYNTNYNAVISVCDYKERLKEYIYTDINYDKNEFYTTHFYYLSRISTDLWDEFYTYFLKQEPDFNIWEVEKVQLYYVFKDLYNYDDFYIENEMWIKIDDKYKNYDLDIHRLVLSENLLVWWDRDWEWDKPKWRVPNYITNDEIKYLNDMFDLDVSKYNNVNLASSDGDIFEVLDAEWKELYITMLETVLKNTSNEATLFLVWEYLKDFKESVNK